MLIFNSLRFNSKLMNDVQSGTFATLCTFLSDHQDCTLREIKQAFPMTQKMEKIIEPLITEEIIERNHGRYRLKNAKITCQMQETITKEIALLCKQSATSLEKWLEENSYFDTTDYHEKKTYLLIFSLVTHLTSAEPFYFFEESSIIDTWKKHPLQFKKIQGYKKRWLTLDTFSPNYQANVIDYFDLLQLHDADFPEGLSSVYSMIGDVNPHYFLEYSERKLRRLFKNKKMKTLPLDIFMKALFEMEYVKIEDEEYKLNLLVFDAKEIWTKPVFFEVFEKKWQQDFSNKITLGAWSFCVAHCLYDYISETFGVEKVTKRHALLEIV